MSEGVSVSVVVPTYNRAALLGECLDSLLNQDRRPEEILVVDDGSSDGTPDVVRSKDGPVRYLRQENAGKAAALNRALAAVSGEAVWIVDDDDLAPPDALVRLTAAIETGPGTDLVYGGFC